MTTRASAAQKVWQSRDRVESGGKLSRLYIAALAFAIIAIPIFRAIWIGLSTPGVLGALSSAVAPNFAGSIAVALWCGALLLGRSQGPALLPPTLTLVMAGSDLPRWLVYRRSVGRVGSSLTIVTAGAALVVGGVLVQAGLATLPQALLFGSAGILVGAISLVLLLIGQCWRRGAAIVAVGVLAAWLVSAIMTGLGPFLPWGWVSELYPGGSPWCAIMPLGLLAGVLLAGVPVVLERLKVDALLAQAFRWEATSSLAGTLDLAGAASGYQQQPTRGRLLSAVGSRTNVIALFAVRDLIGAIRTPARLAFGALAVCFAGTLFPLASGFGSNMTLGAAAGLLLFAGIGPFTDGIRHAAAVTSGTRIYGVDDRSLLALHSVMPLVVCTSLVMFGAVAGGIFASIQPGGTALFATVLLVSVLVIRASGAFKGGMPIALLSSAPSPMGDPMPLVRLLWAIDGLLAAALMGIATIGGTQSWPFALAVLTVIVWLTALRWRRRQA